MFCRTLAPWIYHAVFPFFFEGAISWSPPSLHHHCTTAAPEPAPGLHPTQPIKIKYFMIKSGARVQSPDKMPGQFSLAGAGPLLPKKTPIDCPLFDGSGMDCTLSLHHWPAPRGKAWMTSLLSGINRASNDIRRSKSLVYSAPYRLISRPFQEINLSQGAYAPLGGYGVLGGCRMAQTLCDITWRVCDHLISRCLNFKKRCPRTVLK